MLYHGAVVLCNNAGHCITVEDTCDVGMFDLPRARIPGHADAVRATERTAPRGVPG